MCMFLDIRDWDVGFRMCGANNNACLMELGIWDLCVWF